ncbi:hypothetical protein VOLCADRAFT_93520 [Volvox carteri f. nagariensis]|uniref:Semialdehyde dehydrogenase NAD-binding domain-containing protein n=1 Tax=Volvox carteri f. nagariensis TaxID=3068 RepID=D8U2C0_VOLCA|nr:uncharacterized protein VOLCADRAFT_93520 [Volvox carteri f. nagariensis]EFJ46107.1 hypothetical protein VOLCADRAFT_93520 [Volvox carteri f. nagariensis]|eukprot:XP_002952857.1 hypothetical protein VOLCADRAFT_93520 [Volvox carteri f. nagariensis]
MTTAGLTAVVLGATGAVGEALVNQLVVHPKFKKVVTVGRRTLDIVTAESERTAELVQAKVNMDALEVEAKQAFTGADVVFCALGTTRKTAGSAEAFKKVDHDYVAASARLAKETGVPHFSLVSAQGANHKCPANDLALFHALLYTKTKGMVGVIRRAALKCCRVPLFLLIVCRLTVLCDPAAWLGPRGIGKAPLWLLDRGDKTRGAEKMALNFMSSIHVKDVARLMILDALRDPSTAQAVMRFEMADLQKVAKTIDQPPAPAK